MENKELIIDNKQRLLYPDICKCFAIFMATWRHCAQFISGINFSNFLGGNAYDLAFSMPLFFLVSGWFLNLEKIRNTKLMTFIWSKFKRLIIPMVCWYAIIILVITPGTSVLSFYWYLSALFASMVIIACFAKIISKDWLCILTSILIVLLCPKTDYCHLNFMFPFLWGGYVLRRLYQSKYSKLWFIFCIVLSSVLYLFWNPNFTVYKSPFVITQCNIQMLKVFVYRFVIGLTVSSVIIYIFMAFQNNLLFKKMAQLGQYSLVVYTASFFFNGLLSLVLIHVGLHTNDYLLLDFTSLVACVVIYFVVVKMSDVLKKNKITRILFIGE